VPSSRPPPEGSPFSTPELDSVLQRSEEDAAAPEPARSRFGRTVVVFAVVGVVAVGTILGTLSLGLSGGDGGNGGGNPAPPPTGTVPTVPERQVGPRDVDAELIAREQARCPGDSGSQCAYGFYLRGARTTAEQLRAFEEALGSDYELTREFVRGAIGDVRLRNGRGYVYEGAGGRTVTVYLRRSAVAQLCNDDPALSCVDLVAFEL
jgi:hypothetical protein